MIAAERQRRIVQHVTRKGSAKVLELSAMLNVTQETIRRDLEKLEADNKLQRSHGGAIAIESRYHLTPFGEREVQYVEEKTLIAQKAIRHVFEGDTLLLDSGTTIAQLARMLPDMPITVLTNSYHVVLELATKKNISLVAIGGMLDRPTMSYLGPSAEQLLGNYFVDKAFFSCKGVDIQRGITEANEHLSAFKRRMMEHSRLHYLLADHSKFNTKSLAVFARVQDFDEIITDSSVDRKVVTTFENLGCPLQIGGTRNIG